MEKRREEIRVLHLQNLEESCLIQKFEEFSFDFMVIKDLDRLNRLLRNYQPDIILAGFDSSDEIVPELLEKLRVACARIPVILVIDEASEDAALRFMKEGVSDYVFNDRLKRLPKAILKACKKASLFREVEQFEQQVLSNQQKFRNLIENSQDGIIVLTPQGNASYVSPSVQKILGFSEMETIEQNLYSIIDEDYRELIEHELAACFEMPGIPNRLTPIKVTAKAGNSVWVEVTLTNLLEDPVVEGIVVNFRDVTENKLAELILKESEEKFRSFFENSLDGILLTVTDGKILAANPAACRMFQMTEEEICKAGRSALFDLKDPHVTSVIEERRKTGKVKAEMRMNRKDGSIFPVELSSTVFMNAEGESRTSMIIRDISESKKAQEELKASQKLYKQLFENSPLPSVIYDQNTLELLEVNQAAINHYGYNREEFQKLKVLDFLPEEEIYRFRELLKKLNDEDGTVRQYNVVHLKKDKTRLTIEAYGYRLKYKGKDCRLVIGLDVTEKEAYLESLEEKKNKLLAAQKIAKLGYWEYNPDKEDLFWTEQVFEIFQKDKDTYKPSLEDFENSVHPEDVEKFHRHKLLAFNGKEEVDFEHRVILSDGTIKWIHERGKLVKNHKGTILEGSVQDITDQKISIQKLMQSEARQRGILKSQTNYLSRTDLDGYYTYCNEKFLQDFGWMFPDGKVVGEFALATVREYHHERVKEVHQLCLDNPNKVFQVELDKFQVDGSVKSTLWDFICLTNSLGEPVEIQCVGIDISKRVEAEKSLVETNKRYELVSKATSDAIYDWDCQTGHILWSEGYNKLFGYSPNSLSPDIDAWSANVHPEDQEILADLFSVIEGNSESWGAEYRYRRADGEYAFVVEKGTIIRDQEGKAIRMVGAIQDLTDRKVAMQKLMRSEARHRGLIQSQTNYVIRVDMEGKYTYSNNKFIDDFGWIYPDRKIVGKDCMVTIKDYHHQRVLEVSQKCLENPDHVFQVEIDKPAKNGKIKTTLWDFIYLKASEDDLGEIQCVGIDITDRVLAEKEMRFQANLLDKIGQAVVATDNQGIINYWNKAATHIYGWLPEEIKGRHILESAPSNASADEALKIKEAVRNGQTWSGELYVKRKDGTEFPALITGSPVYDDERNYTGLIAISSDNTERKNADIKLRELNKNLRNYTRELVSANKGLEQFSFIVSHNLRSPVANIIGLADLLKEEYPTEIKEQFLQELLNNVKRLDNVITDLNEILQVKVELSAKKEEVNLTELVESIESSINRTIVQEEVVILTDFTEAPTFSSVQSYLYSIFYNLIGNSIKYRKPDVSPQIEIKSQMKAGKFILTFKDNGLGIDLSKKGGQVFGLYKRFHQHVEGKGMGLFMVKTQVELLGGKISLKSKVNQGTLFTLKFKDVNMKNENEKTGALYNS